MYSNYKKMVEVVEDDEKTVKNISVDNNNDSECIICLEECTDELYYFCKICKHNYHKKCYKEWIKKCMEKRNCVGKCVYCQNNSIFLLKKFCCTYYSVKI